MHRIQYIFVNRWLSSWFFYLTGCYFPSGESLLWWLLLTSQMSKYWSAWEVSGDRQNLFPIWAQISVISPRALPYIYINIGSSWICHPTKFLQKLQAHRYICLLSGWASILVTPQLGTSPPPHPGSSWSITLQKIFCSFRGLPHCRKGQFNLLLEWKILAPFCFTPPLNLCPIWDLPTTFSAKFIQTTIISPPLSHLSSPPKHLPSLLPRVHSQHSSWRGLFIYLSF